MFALRSLAIVLGIFFLAFSLHQIWSVMEGNLDLVVMPGPGNVVVIILAMIAGLIALNFGFARIVLLDFVLILVRLAIFVLAILAGIEFIGSVYPEPFDGPLTYLGLLDVFQYYEGPIGIKWFVFLMCWFGFALFGSLGSVMKERDWDQ